MGIWPRISRRFESHKSFAKKAVEMPNMMMPQYAGDSRILSRRRHCSDWWSPANDLHLDCCCRKKKLWEPKRQTKGTERAQSTLLAPREDDAKRKDDKPRGRERARTGLAAEREKLRGGSVLSRTRSEREKALPGGCESEREASGLEQGSSPRGGTR